MSADRVIDQTRERILNYAVDLFAEKGYKGTSMREIAEAATVSKASIYYHFASKEELYRFMITRDFEQLKAYIEELKERAGEPETLLWEFIGYYVNFLDCHRTLIRLFFRELASGEARLFSLLPDIKEDILVSLSGLLDRARGGQPGYDADMEANAILGVSNVLTVHCLGEKTFDEAGVVRYIRDLFRCKQVPE